MKTVFCLGVGRGHPMSPVCIMSTLSNDEFCSHPANHSQLVAAPTHTGLVVTLSRTVKKKQEEELCYQP